MHQAASIVQFGNSHVDQLEMDTLSQQKNDLGDLMAKSLSKCDTNTKFEVNLNLSVLPPLSIYILTNICLVIYATLN